MARKIVITSGKGGVGKTTITANVGMQIAKLGYRTILLDVDIGLNNLDVATGIDDKIVYDIVDIVEHKCRLEQSILQDTTCFNLYYLPTSHIYNSGKITCFHIKNIIAKLEAKFDFILIDCPAGIDIGFYKAIYTASEAIVVTTPHIASIRDADKVIDILYAEHIDNIRLVINRVRNEFIKSNKMLSIDTIVDCLNIPLIGVVSESDELNCQSSINGIVYNVDNRLEQEFYTLADSIINNSNTLYNKFNKNFWGRGIGYVDK